MSDEATNQGGEITFESLELKKPLDKMTAKELRELVIEKIPQIVGASGMSKEELVTKIKELFGIVDEEPQAPAVEKSKISEIKSQIRELRVQRADAGSRKEKEIIRKKISRLKKRTRRLAKVN